MAALLTTSQSRWLLSLVVGVLSAVAIGSSAPTIAGGESMYSGRPGDIRGMVVIMGCTGLGIVGASRVAQMFLPKPWRVYADRLEFTCVAMLWICWTSATMAFSSFTLGEGVCSTSDKGVLLPTCPLLTFDLALLHLLSTATLALLLVILSNTLSPSYYASLSNIPDVGGTKTRDNMLVMWEMAVHSPPPSPRLMPAGSSGYGATDQALLPVASASASTSTSTSGFKRDRFAEGRVISYSILLLVSVSVIVSAAALMSMGEFVASSIFMTGVAVSSAAFALTFLYLHRDQSKSESRSLHRALEVGLAGSLFLLWPLAAISFTLFPSIANRACDNPASSVSPPSPPTDPFTSEDATCYLSFTVITLSWVGAWIIFARLLGLIFPLPNMSGLQRPEPNPQTGHESTSLLRPQVGYGRIIAGEAFELGDGDDD